MLSPAKLGRALTIIVEVILERESRAQLDAFKTQDALGALRAAMLLHHGEADFVLILTVRDINEYEEFTQAYFFDESNISRFKTAVVMDRVKVSLDVV